jgi:hypothetical protein
MRIVAHFAPQHRKCHPYFDMAGWALDEAHHRDPGGRISSTHFSCSHENGKASPEAQIMAAPESTATQLWES